LSADESNIILNLISKGACFMGTSLFLIFSVNLSDDFTHETTTSIWIQLILSGIQGLCFAFICIVPIPKVHQGASTCSPVHKLAVEIEFVVIPIIAILAYLVQFKDNTSADNIIGHWLAVYPLAGLMMILNRFTIVRTLMASLEKDCVARDIWEERIDSIMNKYEEFDGNKKDKTPITDKICYRAEIYYIKPKFAVHDEVMKMFES
jgi:hypothetical protein